MNEPTQSPDRGPEPPAGIELIKAERERQISEEGWTPEHDDEHRLEEMIEAAAVYMAQASEYCSPLQDVSWPWSDASFKPSKDDPVRDLVKAGALIAAEIDRRRRAANFTTPTEQLSGTDRSVPGKPNEITARSGEPIPPPGFQIALPDDPQLPGAMGWIKGEDFGWEPLAKNVSREEWIIANPAQPTAEQRIAETGDGFKIRVELCQQCHCHVSDWVEAEHFNGRICRPCERIAELERENDASNKALAFIKDRITSNDDFDSDELVKVIEERVGRYSQSIEWFAPKILAEEVAELRAANAELERDNAALWEQLGDRDKLVADYRAQLAASEKDRMRLAEEILSTGDAKDRERLDWLEEKRWGMSNWLDEDCERVWMVWDNDAGDVSSARSQTTLRAAIDDAMKEAK